MSIFWYNVQIFTLSALPIHSMPVAIHECFSVLRPGGLLLFRDYGNCLTQYSITVSELVFLELLKNLVCELRPLWYDHASIWTRTKSGIQGVYAVWWNPILFLFFGERQGFILQCRLHWGKTLLMQHSASRCT